MSKFDQYLSEAEKEKTKYKGIYNYHKQNFTLYTSAASEKQAHNFMSTQLAKKLGVNTGVVVNYFKSNQYNIEKV